MVDYIRKYFLEKSDEYNKKYGYDYWNNHVKYVVKIATELAKANDADLEIVEISAILHDIAKVLEERENESHNLVGSEIAAKILSDRGYDVDKIKKVSKCILHHGGDLENVELSKEEWCVRNADILSLFDNITIFFYIAFNENSFSYVEGREFIRNMIYNKYNRLDPLLKKEYDDKFNNIYNSI